MFAKHRLLPAGLGAASLLLAPAIAAANTYTVTSNSDAGSGGLAGTGVGVAGSLRAAILAANANPGADVINFNCGAVCTSP